MSPSLTAEREPDTAAARPRVLVTGASGFIGSHLVEHLVQQGYEVRALVRSADRIPFLRELGAVPQLGDVTDKESLSVACQNVEVVFHLAALVTDWAVWRKFEMHTVRGTRNLLQAAADAGVKRFLHASTVAVYDDVASNLHRRILESAPCRIGDRTHGYYARAKLASENDVWSYHHRGLIEATIVRPAFVYGPRDRTVLPRLIDFLSSRMAAWIGNGDPVIDPIYVTDVASCIATAAESRLAVGQAYNIAPEREVGVREFYTKLCYYCGISPPGFCVSYRVADTVASILETGYRILRISRAPIITRAGLGLFALDRHHDSTKAVEQLGWRPQVELDEGLPRTVEWIQKSLGSQ